MTQLDLEGLLREPIRPGAKGLPPQAAGLALSQIGSRGWNLLRGDLPLPVCVLRRSALEHNRDVMMRFVRDAGLRLAPHGKTTMAPQLFQQQFDDGVWGLTCATPTHLMTYRALGVPRIFYANQLIDPVGLAFVLDELARDPGFEFICLVDSVEGADILAAAVAARRPGRPLDVMIEIGMPGRRCGVRTRAQGLALAEHLAQLSPHLRLRGVEAFEGVVPINESGAAEVSTLLGVILDVVQTLTQAGGLQAPIVSIGGSAFFQLVASRLTESAIQADLILRSGCYIVNDHGMYAQAQAHPALQGAVRLSTPLRPALEVWGHVQSRPEPGLAIVTLGKRDISYDIEPPIPLHWVRRGSVELRSFDGLVKVTGLNDQHAIMAVPEDHALAIGDLVAMGCSHPCTTFDKWKTILVVDDDYTVVDALGTCF